MRGALVLVISNVSGLVMALLVSDFKDCYARRPRTLNGALAAFEIAIGIMYSIVHAASQSLFPTSRLRYSFCLVLE